MNWDDESSQKEAALPQGYQRYWQVSKTALQVWRMISKGNETQAIEKLLGTLGFLKGPLLKFAQLSAMVPELLPPAYAGALEVLCAHAPPMGWGFVRRRLLAELGADWQAHFNQFDQVASFAASLGQVHKAQLKDGTWVACKVQYPSMNRVLENDFQQLAFFCSLYEGYTGALKTTHLQQELKDRLREEIDYHQESLHMQWFSTLFAQEDAINVPLVIPHLSTDRLLTMTWLEGSPMEEAFCLPSDERDRLGSLLFHAWYSPLYSHGILHGDPHMGNITWNGGGSINMLDFGCLRMFEPSFVDSICLLYRALLTNNREGLVEAYTRWGFQGLNNQLIDALTLWASFLFKPFLHDGVCRLDELSSVQDGKKMAGHIHQLLANHGGVTPPKEFLIIDRVAVIMGSILMRLQAKANWCQLLQGLMNSFSEASVKVAQDQLLAGKTLPRALLTKCNPK